MQIADKAVVSMHYTLKDDNGAVIDSSEGREPLLYMQGMGNLIPGLEKQLEGKAQGDKVEATVPPEEAYGVRREELMQQVPKEHFPPDAELQVGMQFHIQMEQGPVMATVAEILEEAAVLDMNHPLADKTLYFDVEIVEVREATEEELSHGHAHGAGGHHH